MTDKVIAFQNANLNDPAGGIVPVRAHLNQDGVTYSPFPDAINTVAIPFTSGSGGDAVVVTAAPINGVLYDVFVAVGSSGSTLDIVIAQITPYTKTLLTLTNVAANATFRLRNPSCTNAGVANADSNIMESMSGYIQVTVSQAGNAKSGVVYLNYLV